MDKYQKAILAIVIIIGVFSIFYILYIIFGEVDTYFPFIIFFPGSLVILIPVIDQKRQQTVMKREKITKQVKE
ncbi:MAG: hypothetical protein ACFFDB_00985 [Promethearchaeota archaeon]